MADETILHEDDTRAVIDDQVADTAVDTVTGVLEDASSQAAVTNLSAPSGTYTQAEITAITTRVNVLTQVLRDAGLIPEA